MKYNLSNIMTRAWELVKAIKMDMSSALKKAWKEAKEKMENLTAKLVENLNKMKYNDYHINAGVEREVTTKIWEKNGQKREYLKIVCYTLAGNYKGTYDCGYVDLVANEYACTKYSDINAETMEYVGR